jgi:hypothetical protein
MHGCTHTQKKKKKKKKKKKNKKKKKKTTAKSFFLQMQSYDKLEKMLNIFIQLTTSNINNKRSIDQSKLMTL